MRTCTKCKIAKPNGQFFVKDSTSGRLHTRCKDCYRERRRETYAKHYEQHGDQYRARAKRRRDELRRDYRTQMLDYLSDKACVVCGESDIRVLEFDHLNPSEKTFTISQAVRYGHSWNDVRVEIGKCQILCANCHKRRTATQAGWYKDIA